LEKTLEFESMEDLINIFGSCDQNIKILEEKYDVSIVTREKGLIISGEDENTQNVLNIINKLIKKSKNGDTITKSDVIYMVNATEDNELDDIPDIPDDAVLITTRGKPIKPKTNGQRNYIRTINKNTITFAIGPAGTGKTFLAVAQAVRAFRKKEVSRIIITRPAVEAGESLGFLPGDLQTKVDPYLRPIYDALHEMMGSESYQNYMERGLIEVAPLAYMRGRTLDDAFIILDEAQNTTHAQMKMFLTRIGFGSKAIITGDITQIDLPKEKKSGLKEVIRILGNIKDIEFIYLTGKDVIRHELVQHIIKAYEGHENRKKGK
jgi:phosphate starvation-inducible PhoH-like protein